MKSEELHSKILGLVSLIGLMGLWACSSDEVAEAPVSQHELPMTVSASAVPYAEGEETRGITRSWTAPEGYYLFNSLYSDYENYEGVEHSVIDMFMTHDGSTLNTLNPLHVHLRYSPSVSSTSLWKLSLPTTVEADDVNEGNYYAYGFIPSDAADGASISLLTKENEGDPEPTYADGAVLTIHGLKAVANDPCVIIGAREGFSDHPEDPDHFENYDGSYTDANGNHTYDEGTDTRTNRLRAGDFKFHLKKGTTGEPAVAKPNYLYFLFDHLYSALSISMRVNGDYHALRRIKLKRLYLKTKTTGDTTPEKTDVTITLRANNEGNNPISGDITYTPSAGGETTDGRFYSNSEGFALTTEYSKFLGHFMPQGVSTLILTSEYDVYDTNGNLIRKDCSATNTMKLSELFSRQEESERGWKYHVNLTINPTYLYVLSEPDLDNPTVNVE